MKLRYDEIEVELNDEALQHLIEFGHAVNRIMQAADPEYADSWTAFCIEFEKGEITAPHFQWMGAADSKTWKHDPETALIRTTPVA